MKAIHQLYATHCTYGTSALEQREGELAERVLGYSARAGSLDRTELRHCYRQIERFLYYYLPTDTPTEGKLRFDAATAPRRMFYCPSLGELQVLGQISYRQQDTAGRPGSYFGHVLFGRRAEGAWPALECLKLWGAAWIDEDSPGLAATLPALGRLDELLGGKRPAIDDAVLLSFLKTPAGGAFDDPGKIIPERWRLSDPAWRVEVLTETLQGFLNLGSQRRENLLLVVEPAAAALLFYGAARLLPPGAVRDGISFSTFEPNADRIPVTLAATMFHAPETTDLRPEAYRRRGYVHNTFLDRHSDHGRPEGLYAPLLVGTLLTEGFEGVDRLFSGFEAAGAKTAEDLEVLADVHRLAPQALDSEAPLGETRWRQSDVAVRYLSLAVHRQLANDDVGWPKLRGLIGSPNQLLVMELIASAPDAGDIQAPLQYLLRKLPPDKFGELLASDRLPRSAKVEALAFHLSSAGQFPEHCEPLWNEVSRLKSAIAGRAEPLLPSVLARLPAQVIGPLYRTLPADKSDAFVRALLQAARPEPELHAAQRAVAAGIFKDMDDERFVAWLLHHRDELRSFFPPPDDVLRPRLARLLFEIPDHPEQLEARLNALEGWVDYFTEPSLAERRIVQWRKIHSILTAIRNAEQGAQAKSLQSLFRRTKAPDYRGLAEALNSAMPMNVYQDDMRGTKKLECLKGLGRAMLDQEEFLPPVVRSRMLRYFEYGDWSEFSSARKGNTAKSAGKKKAAYRRGAGQSAWQTLVRSKLFAFGSGASLVILAGLAYAFFGAAGSPQPSAGIVKSGEAGLSPNSAPLSDDRAPQKSQAKQQRVGPKSDSGKAKLDSASTAAAASGEATHRTARAVDPKEGGQAAMEEGASPSDGASRAKTPGAKGAGESEPKENSAAADSSGEKQPDGDKAADAENRPRGLRTAESKALPALGRNLSLAHRPVDLVKWDVRPAKLKLILHGLDSTNAEIERQPPSRLEERIELLSERRGDSLVFAARIGGANELVPLAEFSPTDKALRFQWRDVSDRSAELARQQGRLRACVLEISDEADSRFLALCKPVQRPEAHVMRGVVEIALTQTEREQLGAPQQGFDFILSRGELRLYGDQTFEIAADASEGKPALLSGLGEELGFKAVYLSLDHKTAGENLWEFRLAPEESEKTLDLQRQRTELQAKINQLRELIGRCEKRDLPSDKAEAVRELEGLLEIEEPKKRPDPAKSDDAADKPRLTRADEHRREQRIIGKAKQERLALQRQADNLNSEISRSQGRRQELFARAASLSGMLYRLADGYIRVDCIRLGEPPAAGDEEEGIELQ